ncbi:MAG: hypothetical protein HY306_05500 [Nitrosomonadales bacterium]|nr:hypothetical protein [Nitrosomonadales bacterium]
MVIISLVSPFRKSERRRLITWVIFSAQNLEFLGNIHRVPTGNVFIEGYQATQGNGMGLTMTNTTRKAVRHRHPIAMRLKVPRAAHVQ